MSTSLLNELDGGDCNGMSYEQIREVRRQRGRGERLVQRAHVGDHLRQRRAACAHTQAAKGDALAQTAGAQLRQELRLRQQRRKPSMNSRRKVPAPIPTPAATAQAQPP